MLRRDHRDLARLRQRLAQPAPAPVRARQRVRDTEPERRCAELLAGLGVDFVPQHRLLPNVTVDFWLPAHHLVIECQGSYFHADPAHYRPGDLRPGQRRTVAHDAALGRWLERAGYGLLALWEEDLARRPEWCAQQVLAALAGAAGGGAMSERVRAVTLAGGVCLAVHHGDLTAEPVAAIVNAANSQLRHGGGVAAAIVRAGGRVIQEASNVWVELHGPVPTGGVALTGGGSLPAEAVIHAVGPLWQGGGQGEPEALRAAVRASLALAHERGLASVALPAISSGIYGFPKDLCASLMFDEALAFAAEHPDGAVREIRFTNVDQPTVDVFAAEFARRLGEGQTQAATAPTIASAASLNCVNGR